MNRLERETGISHSLIIVDSNVLQAELCKCFDFWVETVLSRCLFEPPHVSAVPCIPRQNQWTDPFNTNQNDHRGCSTRRLQNFTRCQWYRYPPFYASTQGASFERLRTVSLSPRSGSHSNASSSILRVHVKVDASLGRCTRQCTNRLERKQS